MSDYYSAKSSVEVRAVPERVDNLKIGNCVDDFFIQSILSIKEKNFVAKVKSKLNNQIYIMKRIDKNKAEEIIRKEYISREKEFLKILNHENIVEYITSFEDSQFLYIITEYVENGDLLTMINSKKRNKAFQIGEEKLMKIFLQCLRGLSFIHSCGIIFRALKPDKILIDNENNIKITNFKYAAIDNENTAKKCFNISEDKFKELKNKFEFLDLRPYQPPEMKMGEIYNRKIDVYNLGLIFCHLAYLDLTIPATNKYSKELGDFIKKMIEKNPSMRPTSEEAYQELKNIYLKKYCHNTGINSCLRCLASLPDINNDFLNLLLAQTKNENHPILRNLINFLIIINDIKQTNLNSKEDFGQKMEEKLNNAVYNFLEELNDRGCINLNEFKELSIKDFLFLLFSILEIELKLNLLNVDVNSQEIIVDGLKQFENKEIGKIKLILNFFNVRAIISENLSVITKKNLQCTNCNKDIIESYKKNYFISFNVEKIKKLKKDCLDIMNAFESLDKNIISREYCEYCKKKANFKRSNSIYNTSQDLIILFDRGENCKHKDLINFDMILNLDKKYIEIMRLHKETYSYILYGVIIRREKNDPSGKNKKTEEYIYYTRDLDENFFTRNDRRDTYNLIQVKSEGDVMGLFYHCKDLVIKTEINKKKQEILKKSQNIPTSEVLNISFNNKINSYIDLKYKNELYNKIPDNNMNNINNSNNVNMNIPNNNWNQNNNNMNMPNNNLNQDNNNVIMQNNNNWNQNNNNMNIPNNNWNQNNNNINMPNNNLNQDNNNVIMQNKNNWNQNINLINNEANIDNNKTLSFVQNNNEINFMNNMFLNNKLHNQNNSFNIMNNFPVNDINMTNNQINNQINNNFMNNNAIFNNQNNNINNNQNISNSNNIGNNFIWNSQMNMHNNNMQNFNNNNNNHFNNN